MTDNRMIIATVVGTGIAMTTVIVASVAIIAGGINDRIGDVNTTVNNRIGDMNSRFDDLNDSVNTRFDDLNDSVNRRFDDLNDSVNRRFDDLNDSVNRRFDAVNRRIDDLQNEMRELRALVIDAIKGADPAAENE